MATMDIEILRDVQVEGKTVLAGSTMRVSRHLAFILIGGRSARPLVEEKSYPVRVERPEHGDPGPEILSEPPAALAHEAEKVPAAASEPEKTKRSK